MENKILVTYASRTGYTAGVAEIIAKSLSETGSLVDVLPMRNVKSVSQYTAVVAGSAIQSAQWLPEAIQFLQANQLDLKQKPFAAFLVCMTLAMTKGDYHAHVATWLDPISASVHPVSKGYFAGALETRKISSLGDRLKFKLSVLIGVWSEGDHRDWIAIRNWAESLRPLLLQ